MNERNRRNWTICCLLPIALLILVLAPVAAQDDMSSMDSMGEEMMGEMMMEDDMMMDAMMAMPPPRICAHLPGHIAVYSSQDNVYCDDVGAPGIGIQSVIDAGVRNAINIWGPLGVDAEVCSSIHGPITLVDLSVMPRMVTTPMTYSSNNLTCTHLTGPGIVVLGYPAMMDDDMMMGDDMMMDGDMAIEDVMTLDEAITDDDMMMGDDMMDSDPLLIADSMDSMVYLEDCTVIAQYNLNFRAEPAGEIQGIVAGGDTLDASARTPNWFKVEHDGAEGWISAHYIQSEGDCG